jgi:leucyl-tRNA synthetase
VWPSWDEALCIDDVVTLPIQVNGKVKDRIEIARDAKEGAVKEAVLGSEAIQRLIEGKELKKFIFVPGRICNLIVK